MRRAETPPQSPSMSRMCATSPSRVAPIVRRSGEITEARGARRDDDTGTEPARGQGLAEEHPADERREDDAGLPERRDRADRRHGERPDHGAVSHQLNHTGGEHRTRFWGAPLHDQPAPRRHEGGGHHDTVEHEYPADVGEGI